MRQSNGKFTPKLTDHDCSLIRQLAMERERIEEELELLEIEYERRKKELRKQHRAVSRGELARKFEVSAHTIRNAECRIVEGIG